MTRNKRFHAERLRRVTSAGLSDLHDSLVPSVTRIAVSYLRGILSVYLKSAQHTIGNSPPPPPNCCGNMPLTFPPVTETSSRCKTENISICAGQIIEIKEERYRRKNTEVQLQELNQM